MFKKLLKAVLPALLVFSFANVNNVKVEAVNKKINVRVDYLEEGTNKELAESTKLSGGENVFATISLPQNLANEYNISKRDFSNESKNQIAANKIYDQELVYQVYFTKKRASQISKPYTQTYAYVTTQIQAHVVATTQVHKQLVASGSVSHSSTTNHTVVTNHKHTVVTTHKPAQRPTVVAHKSVAQKPDVQRPTVVAQKLAAHRPVVQQNHKPARKAVPQAKRCGR
jgi:hypothetical protein